ncbi:mitochondrial fission 1 protein-like [Stegodyphus dumicola]|uniref:mitochondrial fission 1 protein-like n=1 Tax=Stegodyphus dumicola TaxID=202533 RepID=UPI0015AE20D3|nr:mitochondrial fission 1 protein-like [Stegodyphus dumicola]
MSADTSNLLLVDDDMKTLLNYSVSEADTKIYQENYEMQLASDEVDLQTKFHYAWCLAHSQHRTDVKKAAVLLEEIFKEGTEEIKRDSLFYLAVAETRQKNYCTAKKYIQAFLRVEPTNIQAQQLNLYIDKHLKKDGLTGMALFGAATLFGGATAIVLGTVAVGAALGFALVNKKNT